MKKAFANLVFAFAALAAGSESSAKPERQLRFEGVPASVQQQIRKRFPEAFDRDTTLAEVDRIVRWMMTTKTFSNVEVVERGSGGARELVLMASLLRRISQINVTGPKRFENDEILSVLGISKGQTFERKDLVAATDNLLKMYEAAGFLNSRIEIDFNLPGPTEVDVNVSVAEGSPCKIVEINFETANKPLAERARKLARFLVGRTCSDENRISFQKQLTDHFAANRHLTARLSQPAIIFNNDKTQAKLTYLIESAYRYEFLIDGNSFFEDGNLIRQIELDKLFGLTTSPAADLADRIRKVYQNHGFATVEVTYQEKIFEDAQNYQIKFAIDEGPRVRIRGIEVNGNISRPDSYYANFIRSNSSELIGRGFYNRKDFETGYENLKTELQNQGFLRARVQSVRTEYTKDKTGVVIHMGIDEGPLTQVRQIRFEGATAFSKSELSEVLAIRSNAPLSFKDLELSIARLKEFYRTRGYLEMKISNEQTFEGENAIVAYNETNTQAAINFQIEEGPKIKVAAVGVEGNNFTKDYVILRELDFEVGDTLTPARIDDSLFRLQRMGLFSRVDIATEEANTPIADRRVQVRIQERDPGLFTSGVGVTNERDITYRGYLGVAYRNLGGTGRAVSGRVSLQYSSDPQVSYLENTTTFGYLEPYILGGRNRGRINLTRDQRYFDEELDEQTKDRPLIQESNDIDFLVERDFSRHLKLTYKAWGFSNQRYFDRRRSRNRETVKTQNIAKTGPLIEYDLRDNIFNPTRGSYSFMNLEYSDPALGSSNDRNNIIKFAKFNAGITKYLHPFKNDRLVLATSVRGGYLTNLSDKSGSGVPSSEAFFLGGRTTIRGFDSSEIERIPNDFLLGTDRLRDFRVTADSSFVLLKTELRFPISGDLGGAIFYDGGAVFISQPDVRIPDPYRDSAGFGFRYNTPVGPVALDFGFKLDRKVYVGNRKESAMVWHFSIGAF